MRYISLFAGIGGFDLALNRLGHTCVWANEWNKYAAEIYNRRFLPEQGEGIQGSRTDVTVGQARFKGIDTRDIRTVPTSEIPDHDLLVGGFPCQAFSIAGKRRGFDDTRGTLFFEIARILKDKQPNLFILENVKGLLSHDNGNTFRTIISTLTELGYDLQWQVLNSKNFGVPQNRERVFIVGHLRGEPRPEIFPIGESNEQTYSDIKIAGSTNNSGRGERARIYDTRGGVSALTATDYKQPKQIMEINVVGTLETGGWEKRHEQIRRVHGVDGISPTIPTGTGGGVMTKITTDTRIRRLTPTECERLQGFPDGWTEGVSDTQRYKCLGNAVTVNVVEEIAKRL